MYLRYRHVKKTTMGRYINVSLRCFAALRQCINLCEHKHNVSEKIKSQQNSKVIFAYILCIVVGALRNADGNIKLNWILWFQLNCNVAGSLQIVRIRDLIKLHIDYNILIECSENVLGRLEELRFYLSSHQQFKEKWPCTKELSFLILYILALVMRRLPVYEKSSWYFIVLP